jgi:hypothetical protein
VEGGRQALAVAVAIAAAFLIPSLFFNRSICFAFPFLSLLISFLFLPLLLRFLLLLLHPFFDFDFLPLLLITAHGLELVGTRALQPLHSAGTFAPPLLAAFGFLFVSRSALCAVRRSLLARASRRAPIVPQTSKF